MVRKKAPGPKRIKKEPFKIKEMTIKEEAPDDVVFMMDMETSVVDRAEEKSRAVEEPTEAENEPAEELAAAVKPPVAAAEKDSRAKETKAVMEESGLTSEIRKVESDTGVSWLSTCPYCKSEWGDLIGHIKANHKGKAWKGIRTICPIEKCGKHVVDIKNHIRLVHDKVRNFTCPQCNNSFVNSTRLRGHIESVHSKKKSTCPHCKVVVKTPYLQTHIKKVHESDPKPRVFCTEEGCGKSYNSKADMDRHVLRVHLKYKVKCEFCEKRCDPDTLSRHVKKAHHGIFKFYCEFCQAGFDTQRGLVFHITNTHSGAFIMCNIPKVGGENSALCRNKLRTEEGLLEHIKTHISSDKRIKCEECDAKVYSLFMDQHQKVHHNPQHKMKCVLNDCTAEFVDKAALKQHVKEEHDPIMKHMEWCDDCAKPTFTLHTHIKSFHTESPLGGDEYLPVYSLVFGLLCKVDGCKYYAVNQHALDRHVRVVHEQSVTNKCKECGVKVRDLEKHARDFHASTKIHVCDVCNKGFHSKVKLRHHKIVHTRSKEVCNICGAEVLKMKQHMELVHDQTERLTCDYEDCTTTFANKHLKAKHIRHVHQRVRYKCDLCDKEVVNLVAHKRIVHEKVRKYSCPECGKTFQMANHLRLHIARVHLKMREKCLECGKEVQDLHAHNFYVHRKERNFPCDQCDKRMVTSYALKCHIKSVHLGEQAECPDCGEHFSMSYLNKHRKMCVSSHSYAKYRCSVCNHRFLTLDNLERHKELKHTRKEEKVEMKNEEEL